MAIGATVVTSIPVVGTTVHTLAKAKDGTFLLDITDGSNTAPIVLSLRESPRVSTYRQFSGVYRYNPGQNDSGSDAVSGRCTVSLTVNAQLGTIIERADLLNHIRYACAAMLQDDLIEALTDGILE
jgi:hypothetical protein